MAKKSICVYVNGVKKEVSEGAVNPKQSLLQYLREIGLTGTKLGCGEGGCGACTVMISYFDHTLSKPRHVSANACLVPLCSLDGYHVTTVEGIGGLRQGLHPVQKRLASLHGSQCGFCTPGIVMSLYTTLRNNPNATPHEIEESLDGNLCRCTGYRPILDAAKSLSNSKPSGCCGGGGGAGGGCPCLEGASTNGKSMVSSTTENTLQVIPSLADENHTEPIFPPDLFSYVREEILVSNGSVSWYQPVDLQSLLEYKQNHPNCKLIVGNTEVGIETQFKNFEYPILVNPCHVPELRVLRLEEEGVRVGASLSLEVLRNYIHQTFLQTPSSERETPLLPHQRRGLVAIYHMLTWFASTQIRNVACLGGNLVTASPISDMNPMLSCLNGVLKLKSVSGERTILVKDFFRSYRQVNINSDEIVQDIFIPFTQQFEFVIPLKQARRREDDISIVTSGMRFVVTPSENQWIISDASLSFGGMAPITFVAVKCSQFLNGKVLCDETFREAMSILSEELKLPEGVPGGQSQYRVTLSASFLWRAYLRLCLELRDSLESMESSLSSTFPSPPEVSFEEHSASDGFLTLPKLESRGEQHYFKTRGGLQKTTPVVHTPDGTEESRRAPVGEPIQHKSANLQVTGEALYTDDLPAPSGTLHGALVTSTKAHARILSIDTSKAETCPGFVRFFSAKDVSGENHLGPIIHDEEVFASIEVKHYAAIIGLVVAQSESEALYAARQVVVEYEDLPAIISIQDAIEANSFYSNPMELCVGDIDQMRSESEVILEGEVNVGGQEHFYLETNCALVIPSEENTLEIFSSTQNPNETQMHCALACGIPASNVVCNVRRIGGGFGGKETRSVQFACPVALAAYLLQKPVRMNVRRDVDMSISGQRHAFHAKYTVGCMRNGMLKFMDVQLFNNGGYSFDLSGPVMSRALLHIDGCYRWPALRQVGKICRTNQPSHTAFRGFGAPQGLTVVETIIEHISTKINIPSHEIRLKNLYQLNDRTHFHQEIDEWNIPEALEKVVELSNVRERQEAIDDFNQRHKWLKRGLSILPIKYGLNYTAKFMNQGGALVNIYTDGTVLVSHGGIEMGQGLHTKMIQITARALQISHENIRIAGTNTGIVPNGIATAASMGTDMYGMAILNACEQLNERLMSFREGQPVDEETGEYSKDVWKSIVTSAFFNRVNLSAQGFYTVPSDRCGYDWKISDQLKRGSPYNYFTQGAACTEVEVDCLTGDHKIIRSDIVMDVGQSINPAIDIGQIEGAFVQGYGWCTMEELVWGDNDHKWVQPGQLFTRGPGTYKIPSFNDVPGDFRVTLMDKSNKRAVHSSKGIGEPPYFLACTAFFAIRNALVAAREQNGISRDEYFQFNLPSTSERIRMMCGDEISNLTLNGNHHFQTKGSW